MIRSYIVTDDERNDRDDNRVAGEIQKHRHRQNSEGPSKIRYSHEGFSRLINA